MVKSSNFVSPEPERRQRKAEAAAKMVGDIFLGRKKVSEAVREYNEIVKKIEAERRMDDLIKY